MFSFDPEKKKREEKQHQEEIKQKKIDNMIEEYEKLKNKNLINKKKAESNKKNLSSYWVKNKHGDRFLKFMSPAFAVICGGCAFWGVGFLVGEVSKIASFLNGISLPSSFTNILFTAPFWKFVGILAAVCVLAFIVYSIFDIVKNKSIKASKSEYKNKFISKSKTIQKLNELESDGQILLNNKVFALERENEHKNIKYNKNIDKDSYNNNFNKSNQYDIYNEYKILNDKLNIDINDRNKQVIIDGNEKNFINDNKNIIQKTNNNKKDYYCENNNKLLNKEQ